MKMKNFWILSICLVSFSTSAFAWNVSGRYVNALRFDKSGAIYFTLAAKGAGTETAYEYLCNPDIDDVWFYIASCDPETDNKNKPENSTCLSSVDRMSKMLLQAKLANFSVHVEHVDCEVTETAVKEAIPN